LEKFENGGESKKMPASGIVNTFGLVKFVNNNFD